MAAVNLVQLSEAVAHNRFSAEFFDPRYVFEPVAGSEWAPIGRVLKKCEYGLSISMNSVGKGFPIFRMNELDGCFALRPEKFANISQSESNASALQENDVLFNRTNSFEFVGRTGIVKDQTDCTFASYLIRLVPDASRLLPEFLTVYLNTPFGIGQIKRRAMRSINQAKVSGSEVRKILIPLVDLSVQQEVADLVNAAFSKQRDALSYFATAQSFLETELGLDKLTFPKPVGYVAQLSNIEVSRRFDPEHFFPAFSAFCASLPSSVALDPLSKHLQFCQRGKQPVYAKTGLPVINSKHVQPNRVILEGNRFALANPVDDLQIRAGDTLINGTGRGTIGRAAPYISDTPAVADNHVTILRSSSLDPAYLSLYLNSAAGQMQVEMHQRGTSGQLELYPFDIRKFLVWPAPGELQRDLRDLYDKATKAERESKRLLDQAKTLVEQLIEAAVQP
jgi:restriction endonuclease S subunit